MVGFPGVEFVTFTFDRSEAAAAGGKGGNSYQAGDTAPAVITKRWQADYVNLKVFLDGPHDLWVTSVFKKTENRKERCFEEVSFLTFKTEPVA